MVKFKVGDRVKIQIDPDDGKLSDLKADLLSDIAEGDIRGSTYDRICDILDQVACGNSPVFVITATEKSTYEISEKSSGHPMRYLWEERYLVAI
jgi:hypothetical protein